MAESAVSAVASGVGNLAAKEASFLCGVHDEVEFLREDLTSLQTFLSAASASEAQHATGTDAVAANSVRRIRDVAYEAENIVDAADYRTKRNSLRKGLLGAMTRYAHKPRDLVTLHRIGKDILRVRRRIQEISSSSEFLDAIDAGGRVTASAQLPSAHRVCIPQVDVIGGDDAVVGFKADVERIVEWLKDPVNLQLTVVSIVATGGAGKTTLARKAYNSAAVKEHFDAFAFVSISQQFEALHVLREIAEQAMGIERKNSEFDGIGIPAQVEELEKIGEQELSRMLCDFLKGKRYLIVLDDVWGTDTWDAIQHAFPDRGNGSRVMLTTRNLQAAKQANKLTHVHEVKLLNEQESWQLFSLKAFPSYENIDASNRQELESVGKNLIKKCNGLPLALVVLGSHLSKNLHVDTWLKMDRCLHWEVTRKWDNMQRIIARSYDDLPSYYLKSCFLYMGSFPEDYKIPTNPLTRLWIAEGFIPQRSNQTLEETADECLAELCQRSMIHIHSQDKVLGSTTHVQMHDVVREWAVQHARKEGFLKVCQGHGDGSDGMASAYRLSFLDFFDERLCISAPNTRSMLGFGLSSVTCGTLRFLRALHMSDSNLEKVSEAIGRLIHLRYIGFINCNNAVLPSSIGRLLNLESLDLSGTRIPCVPKSLWGIATLRRVLIPKGGSKALWVVLRASYQQDDEDDPDTELISQHCQKAEVPTYKAPILSSPAGGFPRLRYLCLRGVQAKKLRFQPGTMPKLVELRLGHGHMATVPEGLLDLPSLEKLELDRMVNELPRETHELLESKGITATVTKGEQRSSLLITPELTSSRMKDTQLNYKHRVMQPNSQPDETAPAAVAEKNILVLRSSDGDKFEVAVSAAASSARDDPEHDP
ncbi:unnamed protein product [Urochloa decumbens]|uniref:Uncharacterized protein n=1 Tax=Urochloa decumbens TaxID=240449 RepID=A0ABC8W0M2_9POAL